MKNKILKTILALGVLFFVCVGGILAFIIYSLPSAKSIGQAVGGKPTTQVQIEKPETVSTNSNTENQIESPDQSAPVGTQTQKNETQHDTQKLNSNDIGFLTDPNIPLSDFCQHLKNAKNRQMTAAEFNTEFQKSFEGGDSDPRIQSMLPLMRTIFREPKMQDLIFDAQAAVENQDENFWQKAAFYTKAALAFQALLANKSELEAVSDRSYLFFKMNSLVASRPELMNDGRIQTFCEDTENAFNTNQPVQFENEKKNFERLMAELDIQPSDIGYDSNYKTKLEFVRDDKSIQLKGGWIEELLPQSTKPTRSQN
jgi:hypothetical protein